MVKGWMPKSSRCPLRWHKTTSSRTSGVLPCNCLSTSSLGRRDDAAPTQFLTLPKIYWRFNYGLRHPLIIDFSQHSCNFIIINIKKFVLGNERNLFLTMRWKVGTKIRGWIPSTRCKVGRRRWSESGGDTFNSNWKLVPPNPEDIANMWLGSTTLNIWTDCD